MPQQSVLAESRFLAEVADTGRRQVSVSRRRSAYMTRHRQHPRPVRRSRCLSSAESSREK